VRIATTGKFFNWESLDDSPDMRALHLFFDLLPDGKLLGALRHQDCCRVTSMY